MARFRGTVQGGRTAASRLGHRELVTECNGWETGVRVEARPAADGSYVDVFEVYATGGSNGRMIGRHVATVTLDVHGELDVRQYGEVRNGAPV